MTERRLAAILAADVVGYSKLMGTDEPGTLAAVRELRADILEPLIGEHQGRIFKQMGDGFMAEFASVVNAVACAIAIQKAAALRNGNQPDDHRIELRIGVHLGDVIAEGGDLFGDGVNIAARIEPMAPAGGLAISGMVHENIGTRIEANFEDLGEQQLKNIARPVRVYRLGTQATSPRSITATANARPGIAVLPFTNMSGDAEQAYFADGITEDISIELSRFRGLAVIARNSSFLYRGRAVDARQVGRDLGADYLVEGSVRKLGSRIRITAQLIEAAEGKHVWSEKYDRELSELFEVQDELTRTIVAMVFRRIEDAELDLASTVRTKSPAAHDLVLRGVVHIRGYGADDNRLARELFEKAVEVDPNYGLAHAYLALALLVEHRYAAAPEEIKKRAIEIATGAVRLDPRESRCELFLGQAYRFAGNFDLALTHMERGVSLNPNDSNAIGQYGGLLAVSGRIDEGISLIRRAIELDPFAPPGVWGALSLALFLAGRYEESLEASARIGRDKRPWQLARDAASLAMLDRLDDARSVAAEVLRRQPNFRIRTELPTYRRQFDAQHVLEAMLKAGLPE